MDNANVSMQYTLQNQPQNQQFQVVQTQKPSQNVGHCLYNLIVLNDDESEKKQCAAIFYY